MGKLQVVFGSPAILLRCFFTTKITKGTKILALRALRDLRGKLKNKNYWRFAFSILLAFVRE